MKIGKIPNSVLKEIVLDKIKGSRKEVLLRPKVGEDCCAVDFENKVCVLSSDPITGAENEIGRLAVHISCNDVASCGAEPLGLIVTILVPPTATQKDLELVMSQISETANSLNVDIIGGHTEVTGAVNRFVIITTAVGYVLKDKLVSTSGAMVGDDIILTKFAGIEGTAIIAHDKESELKDKIEKDVLEKAKSLVKDISVVKEGIIAGRFGVNSMHDVTEGGVLGAVWEVAEASEKGAVIYADKIPVLKETLKICNIYNIDPFRLISSGCMIITCKNGKDLVKELEENGIKATVIGQITEGNEKRLVLKDGYIDINEPLSDELYKVVN
ncbi:AIR synthase family protein [Acetivibrio clariflavus]|uniref:Hydrogenase maturation factor n=1 Tax=Acetivibrio clariflavus (strain DSM 19732 / NBRC 101661 / EBR45) TaxID=720554 RepID=G8M1B7_ACECE|nr:AIR synthase family protein [Acetivibrio clariflavus]AEV68093.1 hydrogenase maturation factor [Acetivibrio clariflavus DSM 19732]